MSKRKLFYNALIISDKEPYKGYLAIENKDILAIGAGEPDIELKALCEEKEDLEGKWLMPGVIDDQVHFRDPGLTHKGDMETESRAAVAGGVTSFMDMPNTKPQTTTVEAWRDKMRRGADVSWANYGFFFGATNDNIGEIAKLDSTAIPGLKVFLGSSTGNMLVDDDDVLDKIFSLPYIIAVHSEDENIIRANAKRFKELYGDDVPIAAHPLIRSAEACAESTAKAIQRAKRLGTRLHILHISTAEEADMLDNSPLKERRITGEVCVHHLWFTDEDYKRLGALIKWNPAVKTAEDRAVLRRAVADGRIQIVATDHAPHLLEEKRGGALKAASGGPGVQYSLLIMLELALQGVVTPLQVVELMCHNPAILFGVQKRGFLRPGYRADLVVIAPGKLTVGGEHVYSRCGWTPYKEVRFNHSVEATYVNGKLAYKNGEFVTRNPEALSFDK